MHISLDITDDKARQFLEFLRTLDFIRINEDETDFVIPESHLSLMDERLEYYNANPDKTKDFQKYLNDLKKGL